MDFEGAKENIQPLASGRNASVLACSLTSHSDLQKQREVLEVAIRNYEGDDPLEPWYEYILWIEQSYPSGGNESGLKKVLLKCLMTFEDTKEYYQDRRMIRIFIKYIDTEENPIELYQELFNSGIGTMIADLYICWAYYYDLAGNFQKADSIFKKGLELRAQPYDELEQAHKHFGFTMSQRILHQDETSKEEFMASMRERRHALTSLRPHKKKVGSIRTGSVVKSTNPGKIKVDEPRAGPSGFRNAKVQVFEDQNKDPNFPLLSTEPEEHHIPIVRNIIDSVRKQENMKEPGPWTKGLKKRGHLFDKSTTHTHEIGFTILEDDMSIEGQNVDKHLINLPKHPDNYSKGILLPKNFARKNYPQGIWKVVGVADNEIKPQTYPQYNKMFHYPKPDLEFSMEEVLAYKWFERNHKQNQFTEMYKKYFANEISVGIRLYKNFAKKNLPEKNDFKLSEFKHSIPVNTKFVINLEEIYNGIHTGIISEEKQFEEILFEKLNSGKRKLKFDGDNTIIVAEEMDETQCFANIVGRKSIYPSRKSMAPFASERKTIFKPFIPSIEEQNTTENHFDNKSTNKSTILPINEVPPQKTESRKSVITENIACTPSKENKNEKLEEDEIIKKNVSNEKITSVKIFQKITESVCKDNTIDCSKIFAPVMSENVCPSVNDVRKEINEELSKNNPESETINLPEDKEIANNDIFVDETSKEQAVTKTNIEKKNSNNFEIFEDSEESFKFIPPHPVKNVLQPKSPILIYEDDVQDNVGLKVPQHQGFGADETFSTQAFNLLIRPQSVSTPIGKQNVITHFKENNYSSTANKEIQFQENRAKKSFDNNFCNLPEPEQKIVVNVNSITNENVNVKPVNNSPEILLYSNEPSLSVSPEGPEQQPCKKLSTIMEISETNTLPTGSTKSSVDTYSSFNNDVENNMKTIEIRNKSIIETSKMNKSGINNKLIEASHKSNDFIRNKTLDSFNSKSLQSHKENNITSDSNNHIKNISLRDINQEQFVENNENEIKRKSVIQIRNSVGFTSFTNDKSVMKNSEKEHSVLLNQEASKNNESKNTKVNSENIFNENNSSPLNPLLCSKIAEKTSQKISDDTTTCLNMKSIQIFEEKTETVPKLLFKRKAVIEEQPPDDLYNFFVKTPERKGPSIALPMFSTAAPKVSFEINDTITFSNLNELTLPKFPDHDNFLMKDSPIAKLGKVSFIKDRSENREKSFIEPKALTTITTKDSFDDQLPTSFNLKDLTFPKLPPLDNSLQNIGRKSKKLSFLQKSNELINNETLPIEGNSNLSKTSFVIDQFQKRGIDSNKNDTNFSNKSISNRTLENQHKNLRKSIEDPIFEDNIQTDAFALHINSIKNSTFLPQKQSEISKQILEKSIHIKEEIFDDEEVRVPLNYSGKHCNKSPIIQNNSKLQISNYYGKSTNDVEMPEIGSLVIKEVKSVVDIQENDKCIIDDTNEFGRSIYYKYSIKTPTVAKHIWNDTEDEDCTEENFIHNRPENLDHTNLLLNEKVMQTDLNPFSLELNKVFLESIEFTSYLESLNNCELKGKLCMLSKGDEIVIKSNVFMVSKIIGEGGFGTIYSGKLKSSGKLYALKQEKPANLWEYYICLELRSRLQNTNILPGFMDIEYALIGNNASILISELSPYGSLITICNSHKRKTTKNVDEYIVMLLTSQILSIIDHLHGSQIIHADIKPDNFLLMSKLSYPSKKLAVQLIDFGISIDLKLFPKNQTFMYKHVKEDFKCVEMREDRPWTYQTDLFGLAGTIHVLLYGKYMDIQKNLSGMWVPKQRIPRYINKSIWEPIFQSLLNVRDCNIMPNLQNLRKIIEETLADKEKYVHEKVNEFNLCLEN